MQYSIINCGLPWWLSGKDPPASVGDAGFIPGSERSHGEGSGSPLQYSCLGNPMDRGAWQTIVHGVIRVGHYLVTKQQQIINCSPHGVYHICMRYLYYNWKFVPLDPLNPFSYPQPPSQQPPICSLYLWAWFCLFCEVFFIPIKWNHSIFVFLWLVSLSVMASSFIRVVKNAKIPFFFYGLVIFLSVCVCIYNPRPPAIFSLFIHSLMDT